MQYDPKRTIEAPTRNKEDGPLMLATQDGMKEMDLGLVCFIATKDYQVPPSATWDAIFEIEKLQTKIKANKPGVLTEEETALLLKCVLASDLPWQAKLFVKKLADVDVEPEKLRAV